MQTTFIANDSTSKAIQKRSADKFSTSFFGSVILTEKEGFEPSRRVNDLHP